MLKYQNSNIPAEICRIEFHEDHLVLENNLNMSGGLLKLSTPSSSPVHEAKRQITNRNAVLNGGNPGRAGGDFQQNGKRQGIELAIPAIKISDTDNPKNKNGERRILTRDMNLL